MRHGSLFSGIGGFDLAAEWMGWENVFHCEWNKFGQKVLKYYWPNSISYNDITKTDFTIHRGSIDILTGGFPCQPYSQAGKRLGKEDERHLWPEMLRAIREIKPTWVVGENVLGLVNWNGGLVFDEVQTDLEAEGYEVQPFILPAASVNAPHQRDRVWFVAYNASNSLSIRLQFSKNGGKMGKRQTEICYKRDKSSNGVKANGKISNASYSDNEGCKLNRTQPITEKQEQVGTRYWKSFRNNTWENFPTQSPVCFRNDGLSTRLDGITFSKWRIESIKAGGNAIVPQVVLQIFKAIELYNQL